MNNNDCILVEFVNENNSVAVGYRDWLETKFDDVCLRSIIDKNNIIQIKWPLCEIKSALPMKKIIKGLEEKDWMSAAVRIHAFGEWTVMHKQLAGLQKFNIANPCKEDRKSIMKKSFSDSDYNDSDQENTVTKKKRADIKGNLRVATSKIVQQDILSQVKTSNVNLKDDLFILSDESNETSFNDSYKCKNKNNLPNVRKEIKLLQMKNKELEGEVKALRHKKSIILENKIEKLDTMVDKLLAKIHNANEYIRDLNSNMHKSAQVSYGQQPYPSVTSVKKDTFPNNTIEYDEFVPVINTVTEHNDKVINVEKISDEMDIVMDELPDFKEVKKLKQCDDTHNDVLQEDVKEDISESKINKAVNDNEIIISIGRDVTISQSMMKNVRTNDIGKMTCDLMSCIFTNKEMACSSRTGKKNNKATTGENMTVVSNKKPLDRNKLLAMKDYVLSQFKNTTNAEKLFNNTVTNKCKNVARNYK